MLFDINKIFHGFSPELVEWYVPRANQHLDSSYGLRTVEYYELEYMIDGEGFIIIDGISHPILPNSINFRRPGMVVEGVGIYHCLLLIFSCNIEHHIIPEFDQLLISYPLIPHSIYKKKFQSLFTHLTDSSSDSSLTFKIMIHECFQYMVNETQEVKHSISQPALTSSINLQKAIQYIQRHFSEPIKVSQLAQVSGYSTYHFSRLFKQETGYSPIDFIIHYRMNRAKQLLLTTTQSVENVAFTCGFKNYSYFFRTFKTFYEMSPNTFRKRKHTFYTQ